jgi:hypothetical protein
VLPSVVKHASGATDKTNAAHNQAARGERLHCCRIGPKPIPPCSPVGWSRFRAVLMLTAFYLRRRSFGMARKFGNLTNRFLWQESRWEHTPKPRAFLEAGRSHTQKFPYRRGLRVAPHAHVIFLGKILSDLLGMAPLIMRSRSLEFSWQISAWAHVAAWSGVCRGLGVRCPQMQTGGQ